MKKKLLAIAFILSVVFINVQQAAAATQHDVPGIEVGMSREKAVSILAKMGKKDHDERKQQEIWTLRDNKQFSHIIISFDKEYKYVRFINAKARENGERVRYSDVIDVEKAVAQDLPNNYKYVIQVPAQGDKAAYKIIARGSDKDYLTYFAVEALTESEQ